MTLRLGSTKRTRRRHDKQRQACLECWLMKAGVSPCPLHVQHAPRKKALIPAQCHQGTIPGCCINCGKARCPGPIKFAQPLCNHGKCPLPPLAHPKSLWQSDLVIFPRTYQIPLRSSSGEQSVSARLGPFELQHLDNSEYHFQGLQWSQLFRLSRSVCNSQL